MSGAREKLVRETFELKRDFHYWEFRQHLWNNSELAARWPDLKQRETMLRGLWNLDAEQGYPDYRAAVAGLSIAELEMEKELWMDRLSCLCVREYQEILAEASHRAPANDNEKGRER